MSILEGLVKAESTINPDTDINTNIDMSNKTGDTYNIEKVEIKINMHVTAPVDAYAAPLTSCNLGN